MDGAIACFQETAEALTSSSQDYDNLDSESESDIKNRLFSLLGALDKIQNLQRSGTSSSNGGQRRSSSVNENNRRNAADGNSNINGGNEGDGDGDGFIRTSMRYNNKQKKVSFRTLLNNSNLAFELSELMSHRIQCDLDESCHHNVNGDENNENVNTSARVNNSSRNKTPSSEGSKTHRRRSSIGGDNNHSNTSWTVSTIALMAGRIFVELSAISGAWGAGWIDVGVMKNLEALVRRWGDESRGKKLISSHGDGSGSDALNLTNATFADGKRRRLSQVAQKRARTIVGDGDGDDERRDNYSQDDEYTYHKQKPQRDSGASFVDKYNGLEKDSDHTVPGSIMLHGLQLAESLGRAINNNDYVNWSKDARDAILEASIIAWRVSCAFTANKSFTHSNGKGSKVSFIYTGDEGLYCSVVCGKLNSALEQCIVSKATSVHSLSHRDADEDTELMATSITSKSSSSKSSPEEAVIAFLRGVLPLLTYQVDLPNGVKGKSAGFNSASSLTVKILGRLSKKIRESSFATTPAPSGKKNRSAGPSKTPRVNAPSSNRKTPRSHRKGLDGRLIVPPSLKKTITPKLRRRRSLMEQNQNETLAQSRTALDIFLSLMQKMSTSKGMERGEVRIRISAFLKNCMVELPDAHRVAFLRFVVQLCRSKVSAHRIFAVELIGNFLCMEWLVRTLPVAATDYDDIGAASASKSTATSEFPTTDTSGILSDDKNIASSMLYALHGRINDRAPAVRVRALSALSNALSEINSGSDSSTLSQCIENFRLPLLATLRKRVSIDDKATVRRASITALVNLLLFSNDPKAPRHFSDADAGALCHMCSDSSVGVRKAAIDAILKLIENQNENDLENGQKQREMLEAAWADAVLPLIYDIEMTCAARVVESFSSLVIKPIFENSGVCDSSWRILSRIHAASSSAGAFKGGKNAISFVLQKYLESCDVQQQQRQCMQLLKILHQNIICQLDESGGIKSFCDQFTGSWCFLEAFTSLHSNKIQRTGVTHFRKEIEQSSIGTDFLVRCWNAIARIGDSCPSIVKNKTKTVATKKSCLGVISGFSSLMTEGEARSLSDSLFNQMGDFSTSIDIIGSSVSALVRVTQRLFKKESVKKACEEWMIKLLEKCQNQMAQFISNEQLTSSRLDRVLFTAGELLMIGFHPSEDLSVAKGAGVESNDTIRGLYFKPPKRTVQLIQSFLLPTLPGLEEQRKIPSKIRAHAFAAFGKLCLRDESLAKESINIFARELHQEGLESDPAVKSNALLVLGDFCIRYTHLVDKFLPLMASCLQHQQSERLQSPSQGSSESIVRHHAIMILSNLIMKDYIKWKGILFYRFLAATMDDDPSVSNVAKLFLCGPLLSKQPTLFFHNFVDALFVLNGCTAHPMFTSRNNRNSSMFQADGLSFSIDDCKTREGIYSLLLDHMSPEEKIGITARLSKEVLSAATELTGDLALAARSSGTREAKNGAFAVLSDCFQILTSTKMFIGRSANSTDDSDLTSGGTSVSMSQNSTVPHLVSAKGKLLSKISRKQLVEAVIPILCTLKVTLENNRSPLLKNLMQYMLCIFSQFKKEVNETLASDQTLLQEIKYDMKRHSQGANDCEGAAIRVM